MATSIFHGEPGSYKTSSAIWFTILPALEAGRLVVTNIEGMKPLDVIEKAIGKKFPPSAQLWRISTQNEEGNLLIRNFFSWLPICALLVIDEVQGVYPNDRTFKPELLKRINPETISTLPPEYLAEYKSRLDLIKPDHLEDGDVDDLGAALFDENGHIIYPKDLSDSFMRHRKYQWDIVVCTPDISEVHSIIRSVTQKAYGHRSCDDIGRIIPYYKRRPRILPHNPKQNGATVRHNDTYYHLKVPVQVHEFYKSTATGAFNESASGRTPLQDPMVIISALVVIVTICYWVWFIDDKVTDKEVVSGVLVEAAAPVLQTVGQVDAQNPDSSDVPQTRKDVLSYADSLGLPYKATEIYLSGVQDVYSENRFLMHRQYFFDLIVGSKTYAIDGEQLASLGFELEYKSDCLVYVRSSKTTIPAICPPKESLNYEQEPKGQQPSVSLL